MTAPRIAERYTVTAELGRGGMAVVHRARDARHGRNELLDRVGLSEH